MSLERSRTGVGAMADNPIVVWCRSALAESRAMTAVIAGITVTTMLYVVCSVSGQLPRSVTLATMGELVVGLGAIALVIWRAKRLEWAPAWVLLAASMIITSLATLGFFVYSYLAGTDSTPWLLFAVYLLSYPVLFAALMFLHRENSGSRSRRGLETVGEWLDSIIVLVGGGMAVAFLWLIPAVGTNGGEGMPQVFVAGNAMGDLLLLFGVSRYALGRTRDMRPAVKVILTIGVFSALISDVIIGAQEAQNGYIPGGVADTFYTIALGALAWAAFLASPSSRRGTEAKRRSGALVTILPVAAVILGLCLLLLEIRGSFTSNLGAAAIAAAALVLFVVGRQIVAAIDNGRLNAKQALENGERRLRSLVTNSSDIIVVTEADTSISYAAPSAERYFALNPGMPGRVRLIDFVRQDMQTPALATIETCLEDPNGHAEVEWLMHDADGSQRHFHVVVANLTKDETVRGLVFTMRDIEERVQFEQELEKRVFYDSLTTLANRVLFRDRLEHALVRARRSGNEVAVLFADLDDFKLVNDNLGHVFGDHLLVQMAERLRDTLRSGDTGARLGGDEFAVLLEDTSDVFQATHVAERLQQALHEPFVVDGSQLAVTASIGIAISGGDADVEELLRHADMAMYSAKSAGKNRIEVFEPDMQVAVRERLELQADLRRGIEAGEFVVHYQPIVEISCGRMVGLEALVRWNHPVKGLLLPADFIDVAESTGLIVDLGYRVLREACHQSKVFDGLVGRGGSGLTMAVNLSPRQLREPQVVAQVTRVLDETGLDPCRLVLEVTELALQEDEHLTIAKLWGLKDLGVQLSIDDFGTGYSSLSRLHRFPFDCVKIAKPFVDGVAQGSDESALARAIIGLADVLRLNAVAEGIEREEQRDELVSLGCRLGQGFHYSHAVSADDMLEFLRAAEAKALLANW